MHFTVYWDIDDPGDQVPDIEAAMEACFEGLSFEQALNTFYVVKVNHESDWEAVRQKMIQVAKQYDGLHFIMSPLISSSSRYNGWLPQSRWARINELTK
jgi:hypothetical protein